MAGFYHHTQLFFNYPINVSVQRGDMVYYVNKSVNNPPQTGTVFEIGGSAIREIGEVYDIFETSIVCVFDCSQVPYTCSTHIPLEGAFIMFSKDNAVNMSSILGYYAEVKLKNNSTTEAELFSIGCDMFESSK